MAEEKQSEIPPRQRRERLEPWRPAFAKILFAIRAVQKLEDPR